MSLPLGPVSPKLHPSPSGDQAFNNGSLRTIKAQTSIKGLGIQRLDYTATSNRHECHTGVGALRRHWSLWGSERTGRSSYPPQDHPFSCPCQGNGPLVSRSASSKEPSASPTFSPRSLWSTLHVTLRKLLSALYILVPSSGEAGPPHSGGCMRRMEHSLCVGRCCFMSGTLPLGEPTGSKMGRGKRQIDEGYP